MTDLSCIDYSDKAIVVRGDTKEHKEQLKQLGGKYNANLKGGSGWIFPKKNEDKILNYISSGKIVFEESKNKDLISDIENALKKMSLKERLLFLSNITRMASLHSEKTITERLPVRAIVSPKQNLSPINSDVDSDEEEYKPVRLLKKS